MSYTLPSRPLSRPFYHLALAACCLAAWWMRLPLLARFPFREDEAIYAYWALHFLYEDPFFLQVWPDKPPIFLWLLAALFSVLDAHEPLVRWLNIAASTATVPVVAALAGRWWGHCAGLWAALIMALNPLAIAFAPTGYTDTLLVLAGTLALALAAHERRVWAGVWLGIAIMTKQQGLFYVPLLLGVWLLWDVSRWDVARWPGRRLAAYVAGTLLVVAPILYWDSLRWAVAPSPWDLAQRTYGALALAAPADWLPRLAEWRGLLWYLAASWPVWIILGGLLLLRLWRMARVPRGTPHIQQGIWQDTKYSRAVLLLMLWSAGFLAVHVLSTVQIWDRYLLPLAPPFALLAGWILTRPGLPLPVGMQRRITRGAVAIGLTLLMLPALLPPALHAAQGRYPIGGDHGDYAGLHEAIAWLEDANADVRYILYHQALGWHYRFYLFQPVRTGQVELRWFPSAPYLADNAAKMPFPPKFLIIPAWSPQPDLPLHLQTRGLSLAPRAQSGRFTVAEIVPEIETLSQRACDWCLCRLPATSLVHAELMHAEPRWRLARPAEAGIISQHE